MRRLDQPTPAPPAAADAGAHPRHTAPAAGPAPPASPARASANAAADSAAAAARAAADALAILGGRGSGLGRASGGGGGAPAFAGAPDGAGGLPGEYGGAAHMATSPGSRMSAGLGEARRVSGAPGGGRATAGLLEQAEELEAELNAWRPRAPRRSGLRDGDAPAATAALDGGGGGEADYLGGLPGSPARWAAGLAAGYGGAQGGPPREPPNSRSPGGRPASFAVDCAASLPASPAVPALPPRLVLGARRTPMQSPGVQRALALNSCICAYKFPARECLDLPGSPPGNAVYSACWQAPCTHVI